VDVGEDEGGVEEVLEDFTHVDGVEGVAVKGQGGIDVGLNLVRVIFGALGKEEIEANKMV